MSQRSFSSGELAPELHVRSDLARHKSGLTESKNGFPLVLGGWINRAGTQYIAEVKDSTKAVKLRAFEYFSQQNYVIEQGDTYLRWIKDSGQIVLPTTPSAYVGATTYAQGDHVSDAGINYYSLADANTGNTPASSSAWWYPLSGLIAEIETVYLEAELFAIDQVQKGDTITQVHHNHKVQEIIRSDHHEWKIIDKSFTPNIDAPGAPSCTAYGGSSSANTLYEYKIRAVDSADDESNDSTVVSCLNVADMSDNSSNYNTVSWDTVASAVYYNVYIKRAGSWYLKESPAVLAITDQDGEDTGTAIVAAAGVLAPPANPSAVSTLSSLKTYRYKLTAIGSDGEESVIGAEGTCFNRRTFKEGDHNDLSWTGVSGASEYAIYKEDNGAFGFAGKTPGLTFRDDNIAPDLSDTPTTARNPFDSASNYPACVAYFEQRIVFGNTLNSPRTIWTSHSTLHNNMTVSAPAQDDHAITFTIASDKASEIHYLNEATGLLALADKGTLQIKGTEGFMTPKQPPTILPQGTVGINSSVPPLILDRTVLIVDSTGREVRDLAFEFVEDGYAGKERSVLSKHLFEEYGIVDWCYAKAPFNLVVAVRADGDLLTLTYHKEHDVYGWAHHDTYGDGAFESCCAVREGSEDAVYFVVQRTINSVSKRFIERLHTRVFTDDSDAFFLDCGLTYSGAAATTITGLSHLEGETVSVLADGGVVTPQVVSSGQITIPNAATKVHVGLPIQADFETLDIDPTESGTKGKFINVSDVTLTLLKTRGGVVGPDSTNMTPINEDAELFSGTQTLNVEGDWNTNGRIHIRQTDPLPITITSVTPRYKLSNL